MVEELKVVESNESASQSSKGSIADSSVSNIRTLRQSQKILRNGESPNNAFMRMLTQRYTVSTKQEALFQAVNSLDRNRLTQILQKFECSDSLQIALIVNE